MIAKIWLFRVNIIITNTPKSEIDQEGSPEKEQLNLQLALNLWQSTYIFSIYYTVYITYIFLNLGEVKIV